MLKISNVPVEVCFVVGISESKTTVFALVLLMIVCNCELLSKYKVTPLPVFSAVRVISIDSSSPSLLKFTVYPLHGLYFTHLKSLFILKLSILKTSPSTPFTHRSPFLSLSISLPFL